MIVIIISAVILVIGIVLFCVYLLSDTSEFLGGLGIILLFVGIIGLIAIGGCNEYKDIEEVVVNADFARLSDAIVLRYEGETYTIKDIKSYNNIDGKLMVIKFYNRYGLEISRKFVIK